METWATFSIIDHLKPIGDQTALTAHLVRPQAGTDDAFVHHACEELQERFGIGHATLQIENGDPARACALAPANVRLAGAKGIESLKRETGTY